MCRRIEDIENSKDVIILPKSIFGINDECHFGFCLPVLRIDSLFQCELTFKNIVGSSSIDTTLSDRFNEKNPSKSETFW